MTIKKGLTDCYSETEYDQMICSLQEKWNKLEKQNRSNADSVYSFYEWFHYYKSNIVKRSMLTGVREKCGITNGKEFTTNGAENANSQIKPWCYEKLPLDEFITKIKGSIEAQEYHYIEAISGNLFFNNCVSVIAFETVII